MRFRQAFAYGFGSRSSIPTSLSLFTGGFAVVGSSVAGGSVVGAVVEGGTVVTGEVAEVVGEVVAAGLPPPEEVVVAAGVPPPQEASVSTVKARRMMVRHIAKMRFMAKLHSVEG